MIVKITFKYIFSCRIVVAVVSSMNDRTIGAYSLHPQCLRLLSLCTTSMSAITRLLQTSLVRTETCMHFLHAGNISCDVLQNQQLLAVVKSTYSDMHTENINTHSNSTHNPYLSCDGSYVHQLFLSQTAHSYLLQISSIKCNY